MIAINELILLFLLGVKFANCGRGGYYVISTGVDQMIKMWNVKENQMVVVKKIFTDVADVSNLEVWCDGLVRWLFEMLNFIFYYYKT